MEDVRCFLAEREEDRQTPGAMWWVDCWTLRDPKIGLCFYGWNNCPGRHLMIRLPNGHHFSPDQRASNCGKGDDYSHRCWTRHGEPPKVSIIGTGCGGTWSIGAPGWHGYLNDGVLSEQAPGRRA